MCNTKTYTFIKTTKILLFFIITWILWGLKESISTIPNAIQSKSLLIWLLNATSLFTYLTLLLISFFLYQLIKTYKKQHFFDAKSVRFVRNISFSVLVLAILDVSNRTLFDFWSNPNTSILGVFKDFLWKIIFISPTLLFCSILIFILADFMKKAIIVKNENESFI